MLVIFLQFFLFSKSFRVDIGSPFLFRLILFRQETFVAHPGIIPPGNHLPGNLFARGTPADPELIISDGGGIVQIGHRGTYGGKLVAEIYVDRIEVIRKANLCITWFIESNRTSIKIIRFRCFNAEMTEVFVDSINCNS